jgi:hypothetical protein
MVKVSVEVYSATGHFAVVIKAKSIQHALSVAAARYPSSVCRVKFPIDPDTFFVEVSAA